MVPKQHKPNRLGCGCCLRQGQDDAKLGSLMDQFTDPSLGTDESKPSPANEAEMRASRSEMSNPGSIVIG